MRASLALAVAVAASACQICASWVISHDARAAHPLEWPVPCAPLDEWTEGCHTRACKRVMVDDFIDEQTSAKLISIAERGLARRPSTGGPAIVVRGLARRRAVAHARARARSLRSRRT